MNTPIPIARPLLGREEWEALREPIEKGWLVQGPKVAAFERAVAEFTGAREAVATTSCTTALHLALVAAGVGPGDEVIVPAFTYVATANAVRHAGGTPVLVDVDLETMNLDAEAAVRAVGPRTKAIVPVHLFGLPARIEPLLETGVPVIEDAACALGASRRGRACGTLGLAGCLSFHPRKSITTGEGGMILTADAAIAARCRRLRDHGAAVTDAVRHAQSLPLLPDFPEVGWNYRMTDLQGAIGVVQMGRLAGILEEKRRLAARYDAALRPRGWRIPPLDPGDTHGYQAYVVLVPDGRDRDAIMAALAAKGIATRQGTHAIHLLGAYRTAPEAFPNALAADRRSLALPLYAGMTEAEQDRVIEALKAS